MHAATSKTSVRRVAATGALALVALSGAAGTGHPGHTAGGALDDVPPAFSQDAPGRLVVVTCEDWAGERHLSNVVVTATPR